MIFWIELLCLSADVQCLLVHHMHVVEESQVVVCVRMLVIVLDALLKVLQSLIVIANLKGCKSQIVMKLGILCIDGLTLLKGCYS